MKQRVSRAQRCFAHFQKWEHMETPSYTKREGLTDSDYRAKCMVAYEERGKIHGTASSIFSYEYCYRQLFLKYNIHVSVM